MKDQEDPSLTQVNDEVLQRDKELKRIYAAMKSLIFKGDIVKNKN